MRRMSIVLDPNEAAIRRGIKTTGVGKRGSKALSPELAMEIAADLKSGKVSMAAKGAFLAGLYAKGIEAHERQILAQAFGPGVLDDPALLVNELGREAPESVVWLCVQLLKGNTLDRASAYDLGQFLFSDNPADGLRGLVASLLRVRYETDDEYEGLLLAINDTVEKPFTLPVPKGLPIVQLAEPFDGVDHSYMITPLIARFIQSLGYRAIHMVGRNSGPKFEINSWDLAQALGQKSITSNQDLADKAPEMGWFLHQSLMSKALDRWVDLRHQTVKRPFLSTLERFVNPLKADILIASAFHPPYGEKMLTIAERAGFKGIVIVRNGIEGSIAFPLLRPVKMLLSVQKKDGAYERHEMTLEAPGGFDVEQMIERPKAQDNARLINEYLQHGVSGDLYLDLRVLITGSALGQALSWINQGQRNI